MITTWLTERFGLTVPIVAAPMSGAANGSFAAAVCRAGGLGTIGISSQAPDDVRDEAAAAAAGETSYGIGLLAWLVKDRPDLVDVVIELRPPLVALSYGDVRTPDREVPAADITVATQIGTVDEADQAVDAGVDIIVARGSEGGGHGRDAVATLPLLEAVLDRIDRPVLAAGGIATARGLAAVLAAGAVGAWVGTAFLGCPETAWAPARRAKVLAADLDSTIYTRVYDIAMQQPWPTQFGGRVVRNTFTETWHGREDGARLHEVDARRAPGCRGPRRLRPVLRVGGPGSRPGDRRAQRRRRDQRLRRRRTAAAPLGSRVTPPATCLLQIAVCVRMKQTERRG